MICLVDYGLGNLNAFLTIFKNLRIQAVAAASPEELAQASKLILPGVGAFDWAMTRLDQSGLRSALDDLVLKEKIPVLGVCVGMQIMADSSEEGSSPGLGWIPGRITKAKTATKDLPLPHMGWNTIRASKPSALLSNLDRKSFYFLHSYHFDDSPEYSIAETQYADWFVSAVGNGNIMGTQFHPEKSHENGITLLKNFAETT